MSSRVCTRCGGPPDVWDARGVRWCHPCLAAAEAEALPRPGDHFKRKGRREVYTCLEVREHDVLCYGGSVNPWGHKSVRSFGVDEEFVVVQRA